MVQHRVFHEVAHLAGIGEILGLVFAARREDLQGFLLGFRRQRVFVLFAHEFQDGHKFFGRVVREFDEIVEAGFEARIGLQEFLHQVRIAGRDHDEFVAVVFHRLEDGLHGFLAEVVLAFVRGQRVRFVDEQNAADGLLDDFAGLDGGLAHVAAHEAGAVHFHQLAGGQQAQFAVDVREQAGHRGLAGAGVAVEHHVARRALILQAEFLAHLLHAQQVHQAADLFFHGIQAHQRVQFAHDLVHALGVQVHRAGRDLRDVRRGLGFGPGFRPGAGRHRIAAGFLRADADAGGRLRPVGLRFAAADAHVFIAEQAVALHEFVQHLDVGGRGGLHGLAAADQRHALAQFFVGLDQVGRLLVAVGVVRHAPARVGQDEVLDGGRDLFGEALHLVQFGQRVGPGGPVQRIREHRADEALLVLGHDVVFIRQIDAEIHHVHAQHAPQVPLGGIAHARGRDQVAHTETVFQTVLYSHCFFLTSRCASARGCHR